MSKNASSVSKRLARRWPACGRRRADGNGEAAVTAWRNRSGVRRAALDVDVLRRRRARADRASAAAATCGRCRIRRGRPGCAKATASSAPCTRRSNPACGPSFPTLPHSRRVSSTRLTRREAADLRHDAECQTRCYIVTRPATSANERCREDQNYGSRAGLSMNFEKSFG